MYCRWAENRTLASPEALWVSIPASSSISWDRKRCKKHLKPYPSQPVYYHNLWKPEIDRDLRSSIVLPRRLHLVQRLGGTFLCSGCFDNPGFLRLQRFFDLSRRLTFISYYSINPAGHSVRSQRSTRNNPTKLQIKLLFDAFRGVSQPMCQCYSGRVVAQFNNLLRDRCDSGSSQDKLAGQCSFWYCLALYLGISKRP